MSSKYAIIINEDGSIKFENAGDINEDLFVANIADEYIGDYTEIVHCNKLPSPYILILQSKRNRKEPNPLASVLYGKHMVFGNAVIFKELHMYGEDGIVKPLENQDMSPIFTALGEAASQLIEHFKGQDE